MALLMALTPAAVAGGPLNDQTGGQAQTTLDVQLEASVSKNTVYQGEQLLMRIRLITRNTIESISMISSPTFPGCWQEWYPAPASISGTVEYRRGVAYRVYDIRRAALFASQPGPLAIPPLEFEIGILDADALALNASTITRQTPPLAIRVLPLPEEAARLPVGEFAVELKASAGHTDINLAFSVTMIIRGNGNIKAIETPRFPDSRLYRVFPEKLTREMVYNENGLQGILRAEIPVSFSSPGIVSLPSLPFRYFDPTAKQIRILASDPMMIRVTGIKAEPESGPTVFQDRLERQGEDIDFIRQGDLDDQNSPILRQRWYLPLLLLPFALNLLWVAKTLVWNRMLAKHPSRQRRLRLAKTLRRLSRIRHYGELASLLEDYLGEKAGLDPAEINEQRIHQALEQWGVSESDTKQFLQFRTRAERARFSPQKTMPAELDNDRQRIAQLLKRVDARGNP